MALIIAQNDLINAKSEGYSVGVMAFDLSAAFDTLCHSTLTKKLESSGISGTPLKWFKNYLSGRSQCVLWNGKLSTQLSVENGVPQGSILGPILFLAMISDMPKFHIRDSICVSSRVFGYADDTTTTVSGKDMGLLTNKCEEEASKLITFMSANRLAANDDKTHIMCIRRKVDKEEIEIKVGNSSIKESTHEKLLGVWVDNNLSWGTQITNLERKLKHRLFILRRLSEHIPLALLKTVADGIFMSILNNE